MKVKATSIAGVMIVETAQIRDSRGAFTRMFCEAELAEVLGKRRIVQMNHSRTNSVGAIRGLHYQKPPFAEMKLIRCLKGRIWDVAVDLRRESSTFLQWQAQELSAENAFMLVIPEGCAHGFQVLEPESELLYLHTTSYTPAAEGAVRFDDSLVQVKWPLAVGEISERDQKHMLLNKNFKGLEI